MSDHVKCNSISYDLLSIKRKANDRILRGNGTCAQRQRKKKNAFDEVTGIGIDREIVGGSDNEIIDPSSLLNLRSSRFNDNVHHLISSTSA